MQSATDHPQSPIFIVGPTAVGKSDIAVKLAEHLGAEILNADAFQVYAGLDLLTAKPSADALKRVRHHLVGAFALTESMSVARYLEAARNAVVDIHARGHTVIVVGGTGLYVRALAHGLSTGPASDLVLRDELAALPASETLERLRQMDPAAFARVDRRNPRRVLRALEIAILRAAQPARESAPTPFFTGIVPPPIPQTIGVLLQRDRPTLHQRIASRTDEMFRRGVLAEVAAVSPDSMGPTAAQMIGWRECQACLSGQISEAEARTQINAATRQYAKRQMTWFKREPHFEPVHLGVQSSTDEILEQVARMSGVRKL